MKRISIVIVVVLLSNLVLFYSPAHAAADFNHVLSDFEQGDDNWIFAMGDSPEVKGSFNRIESAESYNGAHMGQIKADFSLRPTGSPFASIKKEVDELDIEQLTFWVKTSDLKSL